MALDADVVVEPFTDGTLSESIRNVLSGRDEQRATSRGTREVARQAVCARALDRPYVGIVKAPNWACSRRPRRQARRTCARPGAGSGTSCTPPNRTQVPSFYEKVVGFTHRSIDMGPGRNRHILSSDGVDRGVADHLSGGARAHWLP